ncbi:MAG TPA: aspartate aminotransferase family protein [Candidatus Saccharimonadales bacterium]|nr:aspartate aminotransferase family protein [Candidatus Saccharimonadales bacterium]
MSLSKVQKSEEKYLLHTYDRHPILLTHGKGAYLYADDGSKYLDFLSGIAVMALGYSHPAITKVIKEQAGKLVHCSNLFYTEYPSALAQKLTKLSGLDRAFFSNSGTEAWEGALKIARAVASGKGLTKRTKFLALENSFHGRTMGSVATTYTEKYRKPFAPVMPGVTFVKFDDVEDLKKKFDDNVCAICIEPIQGEGGIHPVSREFMKTARELTQKTGALLLLDEIQCGLGRTGKMFAFQHYGVKPDVVTLAKPLAAGLPLGAILVTEEVAGAIHPGMHGTTFGGGPLACAVALEVLKVLEKERILAHVKEVGGYFLDLLQQLDARHGSIVDVRGMGLMAGVELDSADLAKAVQKAMLENKIIINRTHETVLRFLPPYIVTAQQVKSVVEALDRVLSSCASSGDAAPAKKRSPRQRLLKASASGAK